jgi:WD40 repeat protein
MEGERFLVSTINSNSQDKGNIYEIDLVTGKQVILRTDCPVKDNNGLAFSPDHFIALCRDLSMFQIFSWTSDRALSRFYGHERLTCICNVAKEFLVAGSANGNLLVWEIKTGELLQVITNAHFQAVGKVSSLHSGCTGLFSSGGKDGILKLWNIYQIISTHPDPICTLSEHQHSISDILFLHSGRIVTCAEQETFVYLYEDDGSLIGKFNFPSPIKFLAMDALETILFAASTDKIYLIDFNSDFSSSREEMILHVNEEIIGLSLNTTDEVLSVLTKTTLQIWNVESLVLVNRITPHSSSETLSGIYCYCQNTINIDKNFKFTPFKRRFEEGPNLIVPAKAIVDDSHVQELKKEIDSLKRINASLVDYISKKSF